MQMYGARNIPRCGMEAGCPSTMSTGCSTAGRLLRSILRFGWFTQVTTPLMIGMTLGECNEGKALLRPRSIVERPIGLPTVRRARIPRRAVPLIRAAYSRSNPRRLLRREIDALHEHDLAAVVPHNVVAVQPVAVLVEVVGAFQALVALDRQDRAAHRFGLGAVGVADRQRENLHR